MKQIIVFPRGQLDAKDKERMSKAGIVAVEADDPTKVVCLMPDGSVIKGNDMLMSAMHALTEHSCSAQHGLMLKELFRRMTVNEREGSKP